MNRHAMTPKPVALFIDEAHDLHGNTLTGLKRLIEIVQAGGGVLSIVLVGQPRLQNDLRRTSMEEIGHRTSKFELEGLCDARRPFLDWLFEQCLEPDTRPEDVIDADAIDFPRQGDSRRRCRSLNISTVLSQTRIGSARRKRRRRLPPRRCRLGSTRSAPAWHGSATPLGCWPSSTTLRSRTSASS